MRALAENVKREGGRGSWQRPQTTLMEHRVSPEAGRDLNEIWLFIAKDSRSMELASKMVGTLAYGFVQFAGFPSLGL
jgi:hypothetical protein